MMSEYDPVYGLQQAADGTYSPVDRPYDHAPDEHLTVDDLLPVEPGVVQYRRADGTTTTADVLLEKRPSGTTRVWITASALSKLY